MFFCFLITDESGEQWRGQPLGGSGGMLPQKIWKSWCSETPFLVFWEDNFCPKCSLNQLSFLCLFLMAWLRVEVVNFISYKLYSFWNCSGYHFQLSILCVVSLYEYHKNSFENFRTTVEIWNFPIPNAYHIHQDSGFSSKIGRTPTKSGWLKNLHRHTSFYGLIRLTRLNESRFFPTYFLHTSFKFSCSMQSEECQGHPTTIFGKYLFGRLFEI